MSTTSGAIRGRTHINNGPVHGLSFAGTVGAELQKVLRQRATWVLFVLGVAGYVGTMLLLTLATRLPTLMGHEPARTLGVIQNVVYLVFTVGSGIFLLLASARLVGMEYSQGTMRILLGRGTGRLSLLVAKLIALLTLGAALLAGCAVVSTIWVALAVRRWTGSFSALTQGGSSTVHNLALGLLLALLSVFCAIVIGTTAATIGRSVAFGVGAAMGLFPADNFGTLILTLVGQATHQKFWLDVTSYLFGPNLNALPGLVLTNIPKTVVLPVPAVTVSLAHTLLVVGVWAAGLLVLELVLTWRRDVLA